MAGTSKPGGVGALTIGGVAAVAVIIGGVVLTQMGGEPTEPNVPDAPAVAEPGNQQDTPVVAADPAPAEETPQPSEAAKVVADAEPATTPVAEGAPSPEESVTEEPVTAEPVADEQTPAAPNEAPVDTTTETDAPTVAEVAPVATPEPEQDQQPALQAPEIDVIRFDPDGAGLIAGRAQTGARVLVLLDGTVIEELTATGSGEFVAFPFVKPSENPRVVTFEARLGDEVATSAESFILAPVAPAAPVVVTEAEPAPVAEPEPVERREEAVAEPQAIAEPVPQEPAVEVADVTEVPVAEPTAQVEEANVAPVVETAEVAPSQEPVADADVVEDTASETVMAQVADVPEPTLGLPTEDAPEPVTPETGSVAQDVAEAAPAPVAEPVDLPEPAEVAQQEAVPQQPEAPAKDTAAADEKPALALLQRLPKQPAAPEAEQSEPVSEPDEKAETAAAPKPKSAAIAVLRAGPEGIELVQPVAPPTPELANKVALDAITYSPTGDVELSGRARPAALVRVYIDNSPVADIRTNVSGRWRIRLDDVAPGIYTLRLDEIDPLEGKVLSRLETPFKREAPEVLIQPAPEPGTAEADTTVRAVTVQKGDTLWAISQSRYGDGFSFVRVFEANRDAIRDPDLIYPGQIFTLPE